MYCIVFAWLFICWYILSLTGSAQTGSVRQTPVDIVQISNTTAEIHCFHTVNGYDRILWYKHTTDVPFIYLGYINMKIGYPEDQEKMTIKGNGENNASLYIVNLISSDSAVYYCAASLHCVVDALNGCLKTHIPHF